MGGLNLYAFVGNDPVNYWDYLGLYLGEPVPPGENRSEWPGHFPISEIWSGSGTAPAWYYILRNALPTSGSVNIGQSAPIGAIGPVTFEISFKASGEIQRCCRKDGGEGIMFVGSFTSSIGGGLGRFSEKSSGLGGGDLEFTPFGGLPMCETTLLDVKYDISVRARAGGRRTTWEAKSTLVECNARFQCRWKYSHPKIGVSGSSGRGIRVELVGSGEASGKIEL